MLTLAGFGVVFTALWGRDIARKRARAVAVGTPLAGDAEAQATRPGWPSPLQMLIGLVTNFFDFLGIGSYATTTSIYKMLRQVPDRLIPGTLLVGHFWPTVAQAVISITIIEVDMVTLVSLIGAAVLGSWLGAGMVSGWPKRKIQIGMGWALLAAAGLMFAKAMHWLPPGGNTLGLEGWRLAVGLCANFTFGALMNLGIGAYLPSLVVFGLLGVNLTAIYPIMMGSCAFIMPTSSIRFIGHGAYATRAALGLAVGGVPGVLMAAYIIRQLDVKQLLWMVSVVAVYAALSMLHSAAKDRRAANAAGPTPEAG